jgi:hypothetical protein
MILEFIFLGLGAINGYAIFSLALTLIDRKLQKQQQQQFINKNHKEMLHKHDV